MSRFDDDEIPSGRGRNRGSSRSINIPPLVACQSVTITWAGQTPFHVTVLDGNEDGAILEDFGETSASSTNWSVDRNAKEVVFALSDASGETLFSDPQPIQPGPDCPPRSSDPDQMAQVFTSPTTKYEAFSSASSVAVPTTSITESPPTTSQPPFSEVPSSSSSSMTTSSSTSSSSSSTSTSSTSMTPTTKIVQIVTLTQTKSTSQSVGGDPPTTLSSSEDLVRSTALASDLHQKEGSKTGVAVGITLGLGIPILLIFLAYYLHRRRSERTEEPYAKFADLHSRPHSSFTSRSASSIYSLRTEDMLARPIPPVPPIPAAFGDKRKSLASITSFGLPYEWQGGRGVEELSPFGDVGGQGSAGIGSGYGLGQGHKREGSEMGDSVYEGIDGRR